mmetsp:Transcript_48100/g.125077  ORF Transcript_48100/g.125077 Transcript_48100/m.125077 type:complete len:305 (+) Transcript_48100:244-1158(+)
MTGRRENMLDERSLFKEKTLIAAILLMLFWVAPLQAQTGGMDMDTVAKVANAGNAAVQRGDFSTALAYLRQVSFLFPSSSDLAFAYAIAEYFVHSEKGKHSAEGHGQAQLLPYLDRGFSALSSPHLADGRSLSLVGGVMLDSGMCTAQSQLSLLCIRILTTAVRCEGSVRVPHLIQTESGGTVLPAFVEARVENVLRSMLRTPPPSTLPPSHLFAPALNLGVLWRRLRYHTRAAVIMSHLLHLYPTPTCAYNLALVLFELGAYKFAALAADVGLALLPPPLSSSPPSLLVSLCPTPPLPSLQMQ